MFSLKGRLKSPHWFEKLNALFYLMHIALIGYITYFLTFNAYLNHNKDTVHAISGTMFMVLILTLIFSLTTLKSHSDYSKKDKFHKNTLDYYLADLNPSKGSFVYNIVSARTPFHGKCLHPILLSVLFISLIVGLMGIFSKSEGSFIIPFYNIFLVLISIFFGGAIINFCAVSSEKLNEFYELEDITLEDKKEFRKEILAVLEKEKRVDRETVLKVCLKIKKENRKIKEDLESEERYKQFKERTLL